MKVDSSTSNERASFQITGDSFSVSYDVAFEDQEDLSNGFSIDIEDEFGLVESETIDSDESSSFLVPEGPGDFEVVTDVEPENGATYTLAIEDCAGTDNDGTNDGDGDTGDDNGNNGNNSDMDNDGVIDDTVPDKDLPDTGGLSLFVAGVITLLSALGVLAAWRSRER